MSDQALFFFFCVNIPFCKFYKMDDLDDNKNMPGGTVTGCGGKPQVDRILTLSQFPDV